MTDNAPTTVLLAEDTPSLLRAWAKTFAQEPFAILTASTGQGAWRNIQQHQPDVVVIGRILPDIDGLEVCRRLRQSPELAHTVVIVVSQLHLDESEQEASQMAGVDTYLTLPVSPEIIIQTVHKKLAGYHQGTF